MHSLIATISTALPEYPIVEGLRRRLPDDSTKRSIAMTKSIERRLRLQLIFIMALEVPTFRKATSCSQWRLKPRSIRFQLSMWTLRLELAAVNDMWPDHLHQEEVKLTLKESITVRSERSKLSGIYPVPNKLCLRNGSRNDSNSNIRTIISSIAPLFSTTIKNNFVDMKWSRIPYLHGARLTYINRICDSPFWTQTCNNRPLIFTYTYE